VSATLLLMGGFMFVLGFINRRESHLAYFGALSVGWALIDVRLWLRTLPVGHSVVEFLLCALLGITTWAAVQFLLRYAGVRHAGWTWPCPRNCAVLTVTLLLAGPGRLNVAASVWYMLLGLEVVAAALWYLHNRRGTRSVWLMASAAGRGLDCRLHRVHGAVERVATAGGACGATGGAGDHGHRGPAPGAAARPRAATGRTGQAAAGRSACAKPRPRSNATSASWPSCVSSR
jgi:hypothetical protein